MKIALHSDLHLEGQKLPQDFLSNTDFDVLVLAGDITNIRNVLWLGKIKELAGDKPVIYVPGNHEYYRSSFDETDAILAQACKMNGIDYGKRLIRRVGDTFFVCCTGWSTMSYQNLATDYITRMCVQEGIADFRVIADFSVDTMIEMGKNDEQFIRNALEGIRETYPNHRVVVVTHFAPTINHGNEKYGYNEFGAYFSNAWEDIMYDYEPAAWLYGHTHGAVEHPVYLTRVLCNQRGYGLECLSTYSPNKIIDI